MGFENSDRGRIGEVFCFPVLRASEARGMRGGFIVAPYGLAHTTRELLELFLAGRHARHRDPCLMVAWARFMNYASSGADTFNLFLGFEVIKLNENYAGARRPDDDVLAGHHYLPLRQGHGTLDVGGSEHLGQFSSQGLK